MSAVAVEDLHHDHAGERALRGLAFDVSEGELFGIVGADGAGKSTLFSILATLLRPARGSVSLLGTDALANPRALRLRIGYMPQRFSLYGDLSVRENLAFAADITGLRGSQARTILDELLEFSRLGPAADRPAAKLSGGMKQKLALCCALVRKPPLLLLDEPTVGVDPVTRVDFWEMLGGLRSRGTTILVSTPYMDEAGLCDRVALLHEGMILEQGTPAALGAALPGRLWRLRGDATLFVSSDTPVPAPLLGLYPTGGDLRALAPPDLDRAAMLGIVRDAGIAATDALVVAPTVEDVLMHALRGPRVRT